MLKSLVDKEVSGSHEILASMLSNMWDMNILMLKSLVDKVNLDNSTSNVLILLDSWTSGLLVYKEPLSVNMPLLPLPEPTISYSDDLDYFKDFENEYPAIIYNDALTSKSNFLTEPIISSQHIDEFNLKDETSLSECDEKEQNVLIFNGLCPFNVIYLNDSNSDKDNDEDNVDIEHFSGDLSVKPLPDVINMDVGAYAQSTVYTAYSLNEYGVYRYQYDVSWGMDTVYRLLVNLDNLTSNVLIPLDSLTSGLLVYKEPLSGKWVKSL
uniref:Uncharacterized protein n=1 Tax=Tanacetum cinerariifolium TaxID=118510 RepID=A0A6L2M9R8_TANCI|nr:hypothetical protein [Tanacetum cinerariifolium]